MAGQEVGQQHAADIATHELRRIQHSCSVLRFLPLPEHMAGTYGGDVSGKQRGGSFFRPIVQPLLQAMRRLAGSGRAMHRALRVARTIADLDGQDMLGASHVAQAVQYRQPGV